VFFVLLFVLDWDQLRGPYKAVLCVRVLSVSVYLATTTMLHTARML